MKKSVFKLLLVTLLCLSFSLHVDAYSHDNDYACYEFQGGTASTGCNPQIITSNYSANPRLFVIDCLSCSGWSTAYDACGEVVETEFDSGWGSTPFTTWHEQCKQPVVAYRTWKGTLTTSWNRCDKIKDEANTECTVIEGNACATCSMDCDPYDCNPHACGVNGTETCYDTCYRRDYGYECKGVTADGGSAASACACSCSECYQLNKAFHKSAIGGLIALAIGVVEGRFDSVSLSPGWPNVTWVSKRLEGAVNAFCTTTYRTTWKVETCKEGSATVKISPNVCQQRYKIIPPATELVSGEDLSKYDAYCVNPMMKRSSGLVLDTTFDATTCETSASTINCGFANILIEGNLRKSLGKYSDNNYYQIISSALQLWGAHSGEAGYQGPGFSPESLTTESDGDVLTFENFPQLPSSRCEEAIKKSRFAISIDATTFDDYANIYYHPDYYIRFMYRKDGNGHKYYRNIFTATADNFEKYYLNKTKATDIYKVKSNVTNLSLSDSGGSRSISGNVNEDGLKTIGCGTLQDNNDIGFCGGNNNYLEALYLYANTVQGNKYMQEHLNYLIALKDTSINVDDLGRNNNPESIAASINSDTKKLTITYKMPEQGKKMICKSGSRWNNMDVCCNKNDTECGFTQNKITIEPSNGPRVVIDNPPQRYDYCTKNGYCYLDIDVDGKLNLNKDNGICSDGGEDKIIFDVKLAVLNTKSAIKRYDSADSPTDHQSYVTLDYSRNNDSGKSMGLFELIISCDGCKNGASVETGYVISENQAKNLNSSYTPEMACTQNKQNGSATYDKETNLCYIRIASDDRATNTVGNKCINCILDSNGGCVKSNGITMVDESINVRKISDPSLNCIVNMSYTTANGGRSYYDYSDNFGVNTDVCRIYCSDEVNIYLANKKDVYVGMHLKYNIENMVQNAYAGTTTNRKTIFDATKNGRYYREGGRNTDTNDSLMLSAIVMQERKCVSKIYYNSGNDSSVDFRTKYKVDGTITNWKELYNALRNKAGSERDRRENLNQLIYDLYNCNLLNPNEIATHSSNAIQKPVDRENVYDEMIKLYKTKDSEAVTKTATSSTSRIQDHRCGGIEPCSDLRDAIYNGGAQYIPNYLVNNHKRVGISKGEPSISYYTTSNADLTGVDKPISIFYCDKNNCFKKNADYIDDFYTSASDNPGYRTIYSEVEDGKFFGDVQIPTRDFAIFTIQVRTDYYNSEVYQTEHYTGKVKKYVEADNAKYVKLDKFIYPVSLDSFQDSKCNEKDELNVEQQGRCLTSFAFNVKPLIWRKNPLDKFTQYISGGDSSGATSYVCSYVSQPNPARDGIVYRSIKLNNPFPNDDNETRPIPTNWMTDLGRLTINDIKNSANDINSVTDKYLEYKYTFTKQALDNIRDNYNYSKDIAGVGYADVESLQNCKKAYPETYKYSADYQSEENGTIYVECESTFLDYLVELQGVTVHKGDGISKCTMDPGCR